MIAPGTDDSDTRMLELVDKGLLFTHKLPREDGTLYENLGWGGFATKTGTTLFQLLPYHRWTVERGPVELADHGPNLGAEAASE